MLPICELLPNWWSPGGKTLIISSGFPRAISPIFELFLDGGSVAFVGGALLPCSRCAWGYLRAVAVSIIPGRKMLDCLMIEREWSSLRRKARTRSWKSPRHFCPVIGGREIVVNYLAGNCQQLDCNVHLVGVFVYRNTMRCDFGSKVHSWPSVETLFLR